MARKQTREERRLKQIKAAHREAELEYRRNNGMPRGGTHGKTVKAANRQRRRDARRECQSY